MKVLIGGAWPYANGSLHIGHVSCLLPSDVIARYHGLAGNDVCYVSGSDCHGTPITIRAKTEGRQPQEICDKYHNEFVDAFDYLNFSYDYYGKTTEQSHKDFVTDFHSSLYESEFVYEKEEEQAYCPICKKYLPDRLLVGKCPICQADCRGDQCENCGHIIEPTELLEPVCSQCSSIPKFVLTKNLYIAISKLQHEITKLLENNNKRWKPNSIAFTKKYLNEGLRDRALTRDLDWGIDVPKKGYDHKKIYIWAENVLGYLSACIEHCNNEGLDFDSFWHNSEAKHYYTHGKDNIPFHTIILPALLIASGKSFNLPNYIVSSEYLTLEGRKISTSQNWAIWIKDLIGRYNPDAIRYYLLSCGPEKRDSDFSWQEFLYCNNSELLGAYGNFINRTLAFIKKSFNSTVPIGSIESTIQSQIQELYTATGNDITRGEIKNSLKRIFSFARDANKYFDAEKPWLTLKTDISKCQNTLYNCVYIIINLAILLEPYLPESSKKVIGWFNLERKWHEQWIESGFQIPEFDILFERLDKKVVDDELSKLNN